MLEPDVGQHRDLRVEHVGGVVAAAEPGLHHQRLRPEPGQAVDGGGGQELELGHAVAARQGVIDLLRRGLGAADGGREVGGADVVVVGTWVDGLILFGQRPGGAGKLAKLPLLGDKPTYVYVTYAINPGRTLEKLTAEVEARGGDVRGGMVIRRGRLEEESIEFARRVVDASSLSVDV